MNEDVFISMQIQLETLVVLPDNMPDAEKVEDVITGIIIKNNYLFQTPIGKSAEGVKSNGVKMSIYWTLKQRIIYHSTNSQSLHSIDSCRDYTHSVPLPLCFVQLPESLSDCLKVSGSAEHVEISIEDTRTIKIANIVSLNVDSSLVDYYINNIHSSSNKCEECLLSDKDLPDYIEEED